MYNIEAAFKQKFREVAYVAAFRTLRYPARYRHPVRYAQHGGDGIKLLDSQLNENKDSEGQWGGEGGL